MKKYIPFLLILSILLSVSACDKAENKYSLTRQFFEYYEMDDKTIVYLESGLAVYVWDVGITEDKKVALRLSTYSVEYDEDNDAKYISAQDSKYLYNWISSDVDEMKNDLRGMGEMFIDFAKSFGLDNHYYLLVDLNAFNGHFVYDYEKNIIWIPNELDLIKDMYERFNTFYDSFHELINVEGGKEWLIENKFATILHGEVDLNDYKFRSYFVQACGDGTLSEVFKEYSTAY